MREFRVAGWLTLVAMIGACTAEAPMPANGSVGTETSSSNIRTTGTESSPIETGSPTPPVEPQPGSDVITTDGWGPLRIGMSVAEITAAAGGDANPRAVGGPDPARCDEFRPSDAPPGVLVMVEKGVLTRISVSRNPAIRTPEGFRIGDPESRVLAEYGSRARIDPHQYWQSPAKYITVWRDPPSEGNARGIRYEIDPDGNVAHIRAGGPSIEYVEGCI